MTLQQLWPESISISDEQAYNIDSSKNGFLRINMVSSLDGAIRIDGRSHGLSSDVDKRIFHVMRSLCDVILVGASTVRQENYRPTQFSEEVKTQRESRGQKPIAPIAVITNSANFDWESPFFVDAIERPYIFTTQQSANTIQQYSDRAKIIDSGVDSVDLGFIKKYLVQEGLNHILCEGGPSINAQLLSAGVIDELCLTINPLITQSHDKRIFDGKELNTPADFEFSRIYLENGMLFLRCKNI